MSAATMRLAHATPVRNYLSSLTLSTFCASRASKQDHLPEASCSGLVVAPLGMDLITMDRLVAHCTRIGLSQTVW